MADITDFRLEALVNGDDMTVQVFGIDVGFVALVTRIFSFPTMSLGNMSVQIILFVELLFTLGTLHAPFVVHCSRMPLQPHRGAECYWTLVTLERPDVLVAKQSVSLEVSR